MPKKKDAPSPIEAYLHTKEERLNNPPVGMVDPETDPDGEQKTYSYDPHIDPQLQWAGKAEHLSFKVPTVSLHVHERIDPLTIIEVVRKRETDTDDQMEISLFSKPEENPPIREAIQFYKHKHNWSNRLVAGDSLLVMNSLLEKEGMGEKIQMAYFDPPYGIKYNSNFQPFVNNRTVSDGKVEDLTSEPEQLRAFRDTWELGIHSYLTYLRDRLLLTWELLNDTGSVFVQISDENVHYIRTILDEVFGKENYITMIAVKRPTMAKTIIRNNFIFVLWYAKKKESVKTRKLFLPRKQEDLPGFEKKSLGMEHKITKVSKLVTIDIRKSISSYMDEWRFYQLDNLVAIGTGAASAKEPFKFEGKWFSPGSGKSWKTDYSGLKILEKLNRLEARGGTLCYKNYFDDYPIVEVSNLWEDTAGPNKEVIYVVQTKDIIIQRCMLMTTDPGDLVFDPTCGSGTTAFVAENWGRRWITCDTSRVALTLTKQRLMTSVFSYYKLAHINEGISSGFQYKSVPHITIGSLVKNTEVIDGISNEQIDSILESRSDQEILYDRPLIDTTRTRITGPFTVEAVPAPAVKSIDEIVNGTEIVADESIARSGETLRQSEWRDELLKTGVRGKSNQYIRFSRIEVIPGYRWLNAVAETIPESDKLSPERVAVSFASEFMPLEQRQVALALEEAQSLVPKPKILIFAAFQFDPEASKDIDETNWPGVQLLRVQMNADLLTEDLKKKRASNDSFWLIGQPEVKVEKDKDGKYLVRVLGFDYYNTRTGQIESGGKDKIAMWMLDTDYDGRSLFPKQVFLPLAGDKEGWSKLAKDLKASIDESLIDQYRGTESLPFKCGDHKRIAVKIVDDRGIESLVIKGLD